METTNQFEKRANRLLVPLSILLLLLFVPAIDMTALACAYGYLLAGTQSAAKAAASGAEYSDCLASMSADINKNIVNGTCAKIIKMHPVGGYDNSGADLYIVASSFNGGKPNRIGDFNHPVPGNIRIDTSVNVYECGVKLTFDVNPLIDCSAIPLLNFVPGMGKPATVTMNAVSPAKLPGGLNDPGK